MKLKNELNELKENIKSIGIDKVRSYAQDLKKNGTYNDFQTRLAWDIMNACCVSMNELHKKYNCNDDHITTLGKRALKELNII